MYYDDEARRFNFLSGLLLGAVLGTGLALLTAPLKRIRRPPRRIRGTVSALGRQARSNAEEARDRAHRAAESAITRIRGAADRTGR